MDTLRAVDVALCEERTHGLAALSFTEISDRVEVRIVQPLDSLDFVALYRSDA